MTPQEAHKIIAEFMGLKIAESVNGLRIEKPCGCNYWATKFSESLDSLVPVWERLDVCYLKTNFTLGNYVELIASDNNGEPVKVGWNADTIQEAACIATAKCIEALNG